MKKLFLNIVSFILLAGLFSTAYTAQAQVRAYRVTDRQVRVLLSRIEVKSDNFTRVLNSSLDQSTLNGTESEDAINRYVADFENATDNLRRKFDANTSVAADVQEVLSRANFIQNFLRDYPLTPAAQRQWNLLRTDLNTLANYYRVTWSPSYTTPVTTNPYSVSDTVLRTLLTRIESRTDVYKRQINSSLDRSVLNNTGSESMFNGYIADFENATDVLKQRFDARRSINTDVQEVLNRASVIDSFMRNNRFSVNAVRQWSLLRTDLNSLAQYYNVSWDWNNTNNSGNQSNAILTGTYRLNNNQSDNINDVIDRAIGSNNSANTNQNDRLRRNLERRLTSPDMLAIDRRNNQITIASSLSPQVTFAADGITRTEQNANGRNVNVKATALNNGLEISYQGDRTNDFFLTFMPINNNQLRVTRRLYIENRNEAVTVNSVYDRTSQVADFSIVNVSPNRSQNNNTTTSTDFVVPNGTQLVAVLNTPLSTRTAQDGDRFTMEVRSPSQYDGAIIEGHVSNTAQSGRVSGRAQMTLNFDTIRLRNGSTYRFAGLVDQVRQANGDTVGVNNEGAVRDSNQTTKTVTRAGIGAALGALIGAIAGGGQGAAIGAGIGAGAGAGTVILQGRDNLDLQTGTEFTITSSAPNNLGSNR